MSLHALAGHMASKGRGSDSMLVHMTPEEVQSLQVLALKGGGTLTINPDTGLPEANFLKKMLPIIAGVALGPAGFGLSTAMAGAAVGGITALSTGSLSRGLMAGLGAYGGAGLGASLMGAGSEALVSSGAPIAENVAGAAVPPIEQINPSNFGLSNADKLSAGFKSVTASPAAFGKFAKDNMSAGIMAVSPMLADEGVQTTTKRPDTGYIRNFSVDPYTQRYDDIGSYRASEYKGMAQGGIVALANGGLTPEALRAQIEAGPRTQDALDQAFATYSPAQLAAAFPEYGGVEQYTTAAAEAAARRNPTPPQNNSGFGAGPVVGPAANTGGFTIGPMIGPGPDNFQMAGGTMDQGYSRDYTPEQRIGINQAFIRSQQDADYGPQGLMADMEKYGVSAKDLALSHGLSPVTLNQYLTRSGASADFGGINADWDTQKQDEFIKWQNAQPNPYGQGTIGDIYKNQGVLDNDPLRRAQAQEVLERQASRAALRATAGNNGFALSGGVYASEPVAGPGGGGPAVTPGPIDTVPNVPPGVSGGGNTVVNPNGTVTTTPNIPGRPEGGFTGTEQVRDAYTQGGGSLGYVNPAPQNMEEFNERFNRQTGDSLAAYSYLMGKGEDGVAPAYPRSSGVEQLMRPYSEVTLGMPVQEGRPTQRYIFENGKYVENPNYVPVSYNAKGERVVGVSPTEVIKGFEALKPAETQANFDYVSYLKANPDVQSELDRGVANFGSKADLAAAAYNHYTRYGKKDGREFTMTPDAKPEDKAIFEWADANNVTDAQLAPRMGITVAEVASRRKKFRADFAPAGGMSGYGGSAGDAAATPGFSTMGTNNAPVSAMGGDTGFGDSSVGPAGGGGDTGDAPGSEGTPGSGAARGGLLPRRMALGGLGALAGGGSASQYNLGGYSDGGRLLRGPGDGVSDSIPATIGDKQPARLADGEFVVPARIVSELGNGSTEAGARKLYTMMDRVQKARGKTTGKNRVAANTRADKFLPA